MSIFSSILEKIFPPSHPAVTVATSAPSPTQTAAAPPAPSASTGAPASAAAQSPASAKPVDVEAVIAAMPGASGLNWKTSIVDLLKVLGLDSSLEARKDLAHELGYSGSTQDSAAMNIWLHNEVVARLAAYGGKVPDSMKV